MHRLFVALRPPPGIRATLLAAMGGVPGARWQDDEQLHITVRFVGEVDRRTADDVALALARIRSPAIGIALAGVGAFDRSGRVDALWAGIAPRDALATLHHKVDRALVRLGLPPDRRAYLPHITLARVPRSVDAVSGIEGWRADRASLSSPPFMLDRLYLYESRLGRCGARYEAIGRWQLE